MTLPLCRPNSCALAVGIWAERYDREITDIFYVQDELTETLVGAIAPGIGGAERQRAKQNPPDTLGVWDFYQRGMWHLRQRTLGRMEEELLEARALFEKAMKLTMAQLRAARLGTWSSRSN